MRKKFDLRAGAGSTLSVGRVHHGERLADDELEYDGILKVSLSFSGEEKPAPEGKPMMIKPLSHESLAATITLVNKVFAYEASMTNLPERALRASLYPEENQALLQDQRVRKLAYYVALDDVTKHVLGVIGQYEEDEDLPEIVWVGWFCVDPAYRGHHVGEALLTWNMQKAKENGYTTMKLYTSDHPREQAAQGLYQKLGFEVTRVQPLEGTEYHIIYRERQL